MEINFDYQLNGYRMTFVHGGPEPILAHRFDRLFVQAHSKVTEQAHILRISLAIDNELNGNAALKIRRTCFGSEFGLDGMHNDGSTDAASDTHDAAPVATAAAGSRAEPVAGADASAETRTESRTRALALRCQGDLRRLRHAKIGESRAIRHLDLC